jgi:hypothetical protein
MDATVVDESRPWLPQTGDASWLGDAGAAGLGDDAGTSGGPSPVGGTWVSCYGGFHPAGEPLRDVTRLGLLCGPPNGMRLLSPETVQGELGAGRPPLRTSFAARRGSCYRVLAVGAAGIEDLDVVVRSSRGSEVARDHGEDRWPIVQPERPFCTFDDDTFTIELSARRGSGAMAAQLWVLEPKAAIVAPPPSSPDNHAPGGRAN